MARSIKKGPFVDESLMKKIQKLNEEGYGQAINEQITLHDETILTIEGIMADRNQLEMYYHVTGDGSAFFNEFDFPQITWWTKTYNASHGSFDPTQNKGVQAFESVSPFARNLTLHFTYKNQQYEMKFPYDAGKAIPVTLKEKLNEIENEFLKLTKDENFNKEYLYYLKQYVGRPTPLYFAKNLTNYLNGAKIYLKRVVLKYT